METTQTIDWSKVDKKFKYASHDPSGKIYLWVQSPTWREGTKQWWPQVGESYRTDFVDITATSRISEEEAKVSLVPRPTVVKTSGHKHAQQMLEYAQDALVSEEPWSKWEHRGACDSELWIPCCTNPDWTGANYRRKIRTVTVEIPEELARKFVENGLNKYTAILELQALVQKGIEAL